MEIFTYEACFTSDAFASDWMTRRPKGLALW